MPAIYGSIRTYRLASSSYVLPVERVAITKIATTVAIPVPYRQLPVATTV